MTEETLDEIASVTMSSWRGDWLSHHLGGAAWRVAAYTKPRSTFASDPFELHTGFANVWPAGSHPYQIPGQSCERSSG